MHAPENLHIIGRMDDLARRKQMSFAEAEGKRALPSQLAGDELSAKFRNQLWGRLYQLLEENMIRGSYGQAVFDGNIEGLIKREAFNRRDIPLDEIKLSGQKDDLIEPFKSIILKGSTWEALDLIQFIVRDRFIASTFKNKIAALFDTIPGPYKLILSDVPTILPLGSAEEKQLVEAKLRELAEPIFKGAREHLTEAAQALSSADFAGSVRESIHAVESALKNMAGDRAVTLSGALNALQKDLDLHPAFKQALEKLYAYTSDEKGVRHSLFDEKAQVTQSEALFMYEACLIFLSMLRREFSGAQI